MISSNSGNRRSPYFEKIIRPSAMTSNIPLVPLINSVSTPSARLISTARLEALGRYFQRKQYVIESFMGATPSLRILTVASNQVLSFLPQDWRELARDTGALKGLRKDKAVDNLLRTLLLHLGCGHSLREKVVRARQVYLADLSDVALLKRLKEIQGLVARAVCPSVRGARAWRSYLEVRSRFGPWMRRR